MLSMNMNQSFPDTIEFTLFAAGHSQTCCTFNQSGSAAASGTRQGNVVIWDVITRSVAYVLEHPVKLAAAQHGKSRISPCPVVSVSFSSSGHRVLAVYSDGTIAVYDVLKQAVLAWITHTHVIRAASFHPIDSRIIAISIEQEEPRICTLDYSAATANPQIQTAPMDLEKMQTRTLKASDFSLNTKETMSTVEFDTTGTLILVGGSRGTVSLVGFPSHQLHSTTRATTKSMSIQTIVTGFDPHFVLFQTSERTLRLFEIQFETFDKPMPSSHFHPDTEQKTTEQSSSHEITVTQKATLHFLHDFADIVHSVGWHRCCFSGNSELILAGRSEKQTHSIHIFHRETKELVNILQQHDERLLDLAYHPVLPLLMACTTSGRSHMWTKYHSNDWAAFAPDFVPLNDNEEYIEAEDEFDVPTEKELQYRESQKKQQAEEDGNGDDIDIMTMSVPKPTNAVLPPWPLKTDLISPDPSEPPQMKYLPANIIKPAVTSTIQHRAETSRKRHRE